MNAPKISSHVWRPIYQGTRRTQMCAYMNCRLTPAAHERTATGQGRRSWL